MKSALITGITGQDGSYLAELLLKKGYQVYGIQRRSSTINTPRIDHIFDHPNFRTFYGDLSDASNLARLLVKLAPDEIYHLGAQSHVRVSFDMPEYTGDITGLSTTRILEIIRDFQIPCKFYQASSSELFGKVQEIPQTETTPFYPRSPYACAKLYAYWMAVNYRESYNLFASNGILFNHESPRRGETFVTRKITRGLARIKLDLDHNLSLGNLDAKRDWGYAPDYVEGMWRIMQEDQADDFILATGETHSVREFVDEVSQYLGFDLEWHGEGLEEKGIDKNTGRQIIEIDSRYYRPAEVDLLIGDASKAKNILNWQPKVTFKNLARLMAESDYKYESQLPSLKYKIQNLS